MTITKRLKCPVCGKLAEWQNNPARPFCSERCKLIDFGHWVDEDYSVPAEEAHPSAEDIDQGSASGAGNAQS